MLQALGSALKIGELRQKIVFTMLMFLVFRIGAHIPVPGINLSVIENLVNEGQLLGFFDVISGGAFKKFSIFAMSITPYINASIIMQLLTVVVPYLEVLAKEGVEGRKKIAEYTRYLTVILGFIQAIGISFGLRKALIDPSMPSILVIALTLTAGTAFLMWLGEMITEKGIGNGISLIIFAGIVSSLPGGIASMYSYVKAGTTNIFVVLIFLVLALFVIAAIVAIQEGQRRIPVQYAKRVVGRKVYGGQSTHIPIKVNSAGVIPVIFAMSILMFPGTIASWFPDSSVAVWVKNAFNFQSLFYNFVYAVFIIFFTYFYSAITFNPMDVADNLRKYGGFIPGRRPGKPTSDYIQKVMSRITLFGALFLAAIAVLPTILMTVTKLPIYFGGTALLIVVGVTLDTMKQMESYLLMRNYEGFMK
ncbi:protein translocase subunit secY/sec61 alpha [Desulfonispora thiosulfatigenes DSM 11270]|uniref:Protein translocase subunit SecY n=1 Tax=Desulfonispora thiosulfatigenes DSM 11270 TaxID=656914 RepID=A0A1W1URV8_DESTI|nr:preprotein translocase subunit SecY [Desulfonispora thiosulfatigenes]SMB83773.1 protein translocase subunit secY/sec61 alpha [Desulfonispora thiosulfatigenes DSM 11270]